MGTAPSGTPADLLTCEGVHEGGQGPIQHLEEGVSARVLAGAAQDRVLQDVGDAGAVQGRGAELQAAQARGGGSGRRLPSPRPRSRRPGHRDVAA